MPSPTNTVTVPVDVLPLWLAAQYMTDGNAFYLRTMGRLMATFRLDYDTYWDLTVAEHRALWAAADPDGVRNAIVEAATEDG